MDKQRVPALFLDLDGTVRASKSGDFIDGPEDIKILPNTREVIQSYLDDGFLIFGVTNQGGVAYGYKDPEDVGAENVRTVQLLDFDEPADRPYRPFFCIQSCYYHPDSDHPVYGRPAPCRKPNAGMIDRCIREAMDAGYEVDLGASLMVGDREEDKGCAENAGIDFRWSIPFFDRTPSD